MIFPPSNRNCCHSINYPLVHETTVFEIKRKEIKRLWIKNITHKSAVIPFHAENSKISSKAWTQTLVNVRWLKTKKWKDAVGLIVRPWNQWNLMYLHSWVMEHSLFSVL